MTAVLASSTTADPRRRPPLQVSFRRLGRSFGTSSDRRVVLRDVTVDIRPGEVLAIVGTSGCGKSTLLRAAAGLDAPDAGSVLIDGTEVRGIDERCAVYLFKRTMWLPYAVAMKQVNVLFSRALRPKRQRR